MYSDQLLMVRLKAPYLSVHQGQQDNLWSVCREIVILMKHTNFWIFIGSETFNKTVYYMLGLDSRFSLV